MISYSDCLFRIHARTIYFKCFQVVTFLKHSTNTYFISWGQCIIQKILKEILYNRKTSIFLRKFTRFNISKKCTRLFFSLSSKSTIFLEIREPTLHFSYGRALEHDIFVENFLNASLTVIIMFLCSFSLCLVSLSAIKHFRIKSCFSIEMIFRN